MSTKICQKELLLRKYYLIRHFQVLVFPSITGYKQGLASMVYKYFDKKSRGTNHTGTGISESNNCLINYKSPSRKNPKNHYGWWYCRHAINKRMQ